MHLVLTINGQFNTLDAYNKTLSIIYIYKVVISVDVFVSLIIT